VKLAKRDGIKSEDEMVRVVVVAAKRTGSTAAGQPTTQRTTEWLSYLHAAIFLYDPVDVEHGQLALSWMISPRPRFVQPETQKEGQSEEKRAHRTKARTFMRSPL
jgi:hypothetical protein